MSRAIHAVLDAALFLLLVGAAVGTVTLPADGPDRGSADTATHVVVTATDQVNYSLSPGARHADESLVRFPTTTSPEFDRTAHGTVAELLAAAAARNVTVEDEQLTRTSDDFERATAAAARNATRRRVAVRATWTPYPGAPVRGTVRAGPRPPGTADVWATTTTVGSGFPSARERALAAARSDGYAGVARVVAAAVVRGLVPPDATRHALRADYPVSALTTYRYRRLAALLDVSVVDAVDDGEPRRANARLRTALAARFERDLRASFDSPRAAARTVRVDEVRVVVRRWSQ